MSLPFTSAYTVTTRAAGYGVDGLPSEGGATSQTVQAIVTPISDREAQQLPEGVRIRARFKLRTKSDLGDVGEGASVRVVVDGEEHELVSFGRWTPPPFGSLAHRKYAALRLGS